MTKSVLRKPNSQNLLLQLITNHSLIQEIQSLEPEVLKKIIHHVGLEDSSELLLLLTSEQLQAVLDLDTWSSPLPGQEEHLDAQRFCLWIQMLLEVGTDFAVEKISEMNEDLLTTVFSQLIMTMESDELALMIQSKEEDPYSENTYLEKALDSTFNLEIEGFLVMSKSPFQWETVSNLLVSLQKENSDLMDRLLSRIRFVTLEQAEEHDGLYNLLKESDMLEADVSFEREQQREKEGFVGSSSAGAFLKLLQQTSLEKIISDQEQDHISKMYFRNFKPSRVRATPPLSGELLKLLNQHGIHQPNAGDLLKLQSSRNPSVLRSYLQHLRHHEEETFKSKILELNFVANVLLSGYGPQKKRMRPVEAMEMAIQVCDEAWVYAQEKNLSIEPGDILRLFKIGWKLRGN